MFQHPGMASSTLVNGRVAWEMVTDSKSGQMEPNLKALMCPFGIYHENISAKWRISTMISPWVFWRSMAEWPCGRVWQICARRWCGKPNNPLSGFSFFFFVKVILVAQISICFEGDVYEGQWKGDKANGEGGGSPAASALNLLCLPSKGVYHHADGSRRMNCHWVGWENRWIERFN